MLERFRRNWIRGLVSMSCLVHLGVAGIASAQFSTATHFPLIQGQTWEYLENGAVAVTKEVLVGLEDVNGIDTLIIETIGGEVGFSQELYTNDALGLEFHRTSDGGASATFVPPLVILDDEFALGETFTSSGNLVLAPGLMFPYSSTTNVTGLATVTVPAGTFDTVVVEVTITINGRATTDRLFLAEAVGIVRGEANLFSGGGIAELVSVPEPGFAESFLSALAFVGVAANRRKRA